MQQLELWHGGSVKAERLSGPPRPDPLNPTPLAQWLSARTGLIVHLVFTSNRSTMLSCREEDRVLHLRLHRLFARAEAVEIEALARYLSGDDDVEAGQIVDDFITRESASIRVEPREVKSQGRFHDLQKIVEELNRTYFHDRCDARITWGQAGSRKYRRSIQLGCFVSQENLIRVHPCLDQAFVPRRYVAWVVFHEMLHEAFGVGQAGGRRSLHPPEFAVLEESFDGYEQCKKWEAANLHRLLHFRPDTMRS